MTYRYLLLAFCLLIEAGSVCAQSAMRYRDFALRDKDILLLTSDGKLKISDESRSDPGIMIATDGPVLATCFDRKGNIVVGDTNHLIRVYDEQQKTWQTLARYTDKLTDIVFNSQNQCFLITNKGIVDVAGKKTYFPDSSFSKNNQLRNRRTWFGKPVSFMDSQDRLWLGFDYGEWGGNVFAFDTHTRAFSPLKIDSIRMDTNPVSAFCEDQQAVYMSGGVSHMFLTHGSIVRFANGAGSPLLASKDRKTLVEMVFKDTSTGKDQPQTGFIFAGGQRIGPSAYNPVDSCLYFYSQNGIYKGNPKTDLSDMAHWQNILQPKLSWTGGRPDAVGPAMNVLKMQFMVDGTLLFLTEHEGLGIYDGKSEKLRFMN